MKDRDDLDNVRALLDALGSAMVETASSVGEAGSGDAAAERIALAAELKTLVDQELHDAVDHARSQQVSWQQIGDVLGITRQAAFQRFRNPDDQRGASHMRTKSNTALIPHAEAVYRKIAADDYASVARDMTFVVQRVLSEKKVMAVWSEVAGAVGDLESLGASFVRPSGGNVVVETPLSFEAGELVGRIAYNRRDKIVGLLILTPDAVAAAPF